MWDSVNYPRVDMNVKILLSKDQMHTLTNDIEIYQDNRDAFMVIHSKKMVMWATSTIRTDKKQKLKELSALRDTLFDLCDATACIGVKNRKGEGRNKLTLRARELARKAFHVSTLQYLYEPQSGKIEQVVISYLPSYEVKRMTTTYKEINFNFKAKINKSVISKILNKNNQLLLKYNGYQLVDNR